jgi:glycosyltransferase involved in cell wall biosynthesis
MPEKINILQLLDAFTIGGAQRLVLDLIRGIDDNQFNIAVGSLKRGGILHSEYNKLKKPLFILDTKHLYDVSVIYKIIKYVRENKIDIIHTHLTDADIVGRLAGYLCGVSVISTLHTIPYGYAQQNAHRRFMQKLTARTMASKLVVVSPSIQKLYIQDWKLPAERIITIANSVSMEPYIQVRKLEAVEKRNIVITTVGRLSKPKGYSILLKAAGIVLSRRSDVQFLIVGDGPLKEQLQIQAQATGITRQLVFAGARTDIPEVLSQSDIFVLPSLWEGLPLTAIEAMAAGRAVILTRVGGNSDLINSGTEGLLVAPGDADALAQALLYLIENPDKRVSMGRAAQARALKDFSMDQFILKHEHMYKREYEECMRGNKRYSGSH